MITKISFREVYFSVTLWNTLISKRCSEHTKIQVLCLKWNTFRNCLILNIFWCCFRIWNYYYYSHSNIFVPIETEGLVQIDEGKNPGLKIVQTLSTKVLNVLIRIFVGKNKEFNITGIYSTYYFFFYILGKKKKDCSTKADKHLAQGEVKSIVWGWLSVCNIIKKDIWTCRCINPVLRPSLKCFITLGKSLKISFPLSLHGDMFCLYDVIFSTKVLYGHIK